MPSFSALKANGKLGQIAADLLLVVLLVYLYFFASTQYSLFDTRLLVVSGRVMVGLLTVWLLVGRKFIPQGLVLPVIVFLAAQTLATVMSIDPRRSVIEVWLLVIEVSLFFLFAGFASKLFSPRRVVGAVLVTGALFMALSWSEVAQWYAQWYQSHPGQWIPFENYRLPAPNFVCTILNVWLMFALARLWWSKTNLERAALGLFSASAMALIYLTSSRGGWFGTAAGFGSLWLVSLRLAPRFWKAQWERVRRSKWMTAGLFAAVLVLVVGFSTLILLQDLKPGHSPFLQSRGYLWQPAWNAFLRSPLWGSGPFTFISFYLQVNSAPPGLFFDYAHNIYLDLLSGSGLLGLASFGWLAWIVLCKFIRGLVSTGGDNLAVLTGALAASGAFLVHGLFDSVHHTVPTSAWNLAILFGAAIAVVIKIESKQPVWQSIVVVGLSLLSALGFFLNAWLAWPLESGVQAANRSDWQGAARQFEVAVQRDPYLAATHQQLGLAYSQLFISGDRSVLSKAENAFEQAVALDPYWMFNYANLGLTRERLGDLSGALQAYEQGLAAAPQAYESNWLLGRALEASGETQEARSNYISALKTCPKCACAAFWQDTPLRKELAARTDCNEVPPGAAWNPGYVAFGYRRPSLNFDWVLVGEK